jgi:hypothetical protein
VVALEVIAAEVVDHLEEVNHQVKKLKALLLVMQTIKDTEEEVRIAVVIGAIVVVIVVIVVIIVEVVEDIVDHKINTVLSTETRILTREESFRDTLAIRLQDKATKVKRYNIMKSLIIRSPDITIAKRKKEKMKKSSHQTVLLKEDLKLSRNVGRVDLHLIMRQEDLAPQEELRLAAVVTTIMGEEVALTNLTLPVVAEVVTTKPLRPQSKLEIIYTKKGFFMKPQ